ncbi:hypothetical protein [Rhizobium sp. BK068]|uniref:hypothetical protein n=1 Tax=Rhizobium sp. BK068 TaxID=2512130 RepID=UPI001047333D|nr:hypothetical protein [Rhizobium sp. BK068]TCM62368.1 hypothetical protein EV291_15313 [Rhizobium sp. BK068]
MKTLLAGVIVALTPFQVFADSDVIVSHFEVLKQCGKMSFIDKTVKELNTPEGKALITLAAGAVGVDPTLVGVAVAAIPIEGQGNQQDTHPFIRSPVGYTICSARPSNLNTGAGQYGIETHGDTTFNSTIVRKSDQNGLAMYMVVPCKASTDTRVQSGFDVTFVKADGGWEQRYPKCQKTGSHPWLARNNGTTLDPKP